MTDQHALDAKIQAYYAEGFDEDARIQTRSAGGQVELTRVRELVAAYVPAGSCVLDVGGATGVHARWLAERGDDVVLIDPVPAQVAKVAAHGTFEARVGDARRLDVADASCDAVLLFGPLYHLLERVDRLAALGEARRVLRPGGVVLAQGIGRLAAFFDQALRVGPEHVSDDDVHILRTGVWANPGEGFPGGHFHTADELSGELADAGLDVVAVHGVEGPTAGAIEWFAPDPELSGTALALARRVDAGQDNRRRDQVQLANLSAHILAVGRR